jgi:hypothetical protein
MKIQGSGKPLKGSKSPGIGYLYVGLIMFLTIAIATSLSGGFVPVDPNSPGGPPTLEPYFNREDYPVQHIVDPTQGYTQSQQKLQLETFNVDNCGKNLVLLFVIDTSGSMAWQNKINHEKAALRYFTSNMGGRSVIGIDTFGGGKGDVHTRIPLNYYKANKTQVTQVINELTPNGGTPTKDAIELAYNQLQKAINSNQFPDLKYSMILMTDGVPEIMPPRTCEAQTAPDPGSTLPRCFAQEEDPVIPHNLGTDIQKLGVDLYAINVYSPSWASDQYMFPFLTTMLQKLVSPPINTHLYTSINGSNLQDVLRQINQNICKN